MGGGGEEEAGNQQKHSSGGVLQKSCSEISLQNSPENTSARVSTVQPY